MFTGVVSILLEKLCIYWSSIMFIGTIPRLLEQLNSYWNNSTFTRKVPRLTQFTVGYALEHSLTFTTISTLYRVVQ